MRSDSIFSSEDVGRTKVDWLLSFIIIGFSAISFAQITSTSPYSYYGLGEMDGQDHAIFSGLGNSTITYFDSTVLNYYNPASYNTLSKGQPIFSTGLSSRLSNYKQGDVTNFNKAIIVNHFVKICRCSSWS